MSTGASPDDIEAHLDYLEQYIGWQFLNQIPRSALETATGNAAAIRDYLRTIVENCPVPLDTKLSKEKVLENFATNWEIMMDVEIYIERLPGFEALVGIHRQDPFNLEFFPSPESPLRVRKEKVFATYMELVEIAAGNFKEKMWPVPIEARRKAAEELCERRVKTLVVNPRFNSYTGFKAMNLQEDEIEHFNNTINRHFGLDD